MTVTERMDALLSGIDRKVADQQALVRHQQEIIKSIKDEQDLLDKDSDDYDTIKNAVEILNKLSEETVQTNYKFIEENINRALRRVFPEKIRQIKLTEYTRGVYPQLEFKMYVGKDKAGDDIYRTIESDSGHGVAQMVSLLSILSLIVIRGERRFLCLDEMTSGMSGNTRKVLDSILWAFAEIGFQFVLIDHGYIPKGAKVYVVEDQDGVGTPVRDYIEEHGVYNEGRRDKRGYALANAEA